MLEKVDQSNMKKIILILLLFTSIYTWAQSKQTLPEFDVEVIFVVEVA